LTAAQGDAQMRFLSMIRIEEKEDQAPGLVI
jgi:hypothetical protein